MKLAGVADGERSLPRAAANNLERGLQHGSAIVQKMTRTLTARDSGSTCEPGNNSPICQKWTSSTNSQTLPIVLGVVIPISIALCVFVYLHIRHKKKQAIEDNNDPHKSLDFGTEYASSQHPRNKRGILGRKGPDVPEMTITDLGPDPMRPGRGIRGLSMDMYSNPYLLPAGLQGSHESLHSMSRSMQDENDPYRPVAFIRSSTETSRSPRRFGENASVYSGSTVQTGNEKSGLVTNARPMSQSIPKRGDSMPQASSPSDDYPMRELHSSNKAKPPSRGISLVSQQTNVPQIRESESPTDNAREQSLPPLSRVPSDDSQKMPSPRISFSSASRPPPRKASLAASQLPQINVRESDASFYGDDLPPPPAPPKVIEPTEQYDVDVDHIYAGRFSIDNSAPSQQYPAQDSLGALPPGSRLSVMGLRPLPQEDPQENAEQRANRIRSFYKEYFDDSRPMPKNAFYEDYDPAYLDAAVYDADAGDYTYPQAPFAQPMGRRAMTPPPRGASHFSGADHARHYSTMSGGRPGPRGRPIQQAPKKKLPPPKALTSLPTPHMLRDDTALIHNPIDFAPPSSFREVQNGRAPDSPTGIQRPYSPAVRAYSPLVPAFDELAAIPSPHHLRKSGSFNPLDFAPRFRGADATASDAGSIRSARSGISAMQMNAVRAGAYRVSKIPKEMVTTREDLTAQLRPKMNLISPA